MSMHYRDGETFPGEIRETFRDSIQAWPMSPRPPVDSPNIVFVVLDDVGFAQVGCFGSDIATPNLDQLSERGLRYRSFHTTAMCSPTRAAALTGRNPHTCGMGGITDLAMGFPGYNARIPKSCAFVPAILKSEGWATFAVGKWHLAPSDETHAGASRERWPLGQGFERYYGFIGAETSQFRPELIVDNSPVDFDTLTHGRTGDYHLSEDLVDRAIGMIDDLRNVDQTKPFFMYLAFGACHSPHQAPPEWIDRYKGKFDGGWDIFRARASRRQREMGIIPQDAVAADRPSWVQDWETLSPDERAVYARMMEVFAGFLSHTDNELGRLLNYLEATGELANTWVIAISDNGASGEGGPHGSFNENFTFNGIDHDKDKTFAMIDELGGPNSYGHYPWGWTYAANTPFKRWKRETHEGGLSDPFIIAGPGVPANEAGKIRSQYTHAIDIGATLLDICGLEMPASFQGVEQDPVAGTSILASVRSGDAPEHRTTQYYEQFACRAIYHDGYKAVAFHSMGLQIYEESDDPRRPFQEDTWELYHVAVDPSEIHDLAEEMPEKLAALQDLWFEEARTYGALPLRSLRLFAQGRPHAIVPKDGNENLFEYRQGATAVPEDVAANTKLRPHRITTTINIPENGADGALLAQGGKFGGFSLYIYDGRPHYTYNFTGLEQTTFAGPARLTAGQHTIVLESTPEGIAADVDLSVDGKSVAAGRIDRTTSFRFALHGEGLCCGYDNGTAVSDNYVSPFRFGGTIEKMVVEVDGIPTRNVEAEVDRAFMTQ